MLGGSPRSGIAVMRVAKTRALCAGRDFVTPDDIKAVVEPVLSHRVILSPEARSAGITGAESSATPSPHAGARLMLTARGRLALLLAAGMYVAAWALGTREAYAPASGSRWPCSPRSVYVRLRRGRSG